MVEVTIPFAPDMAEASVAGSKICTTRNKQYGKEGDWFRIGEFRFVIKRIEKHTLWFVAHILYDQEGFPSSHAFIQKWNELHPRKGFTDEATVFVHFYRKLEEGEG